MNRRLRRAIASTGAAAPHTPTALDQVLKRRPITPGPKFEPLPEPVGPAPYRHELTAVLGAERMGEIERSGSLRFHCIGDTGGWREPRPQHEVARAMAAQLDGPQPVHFFFHLGDIVYPHGEEAHYGPQFFSAYRSYHAPIFAIPGNHDGEVARYTRSGPLEPFVKTFCSASEPLHDAAVPVPRPPAAQPHVHWTLVHDWVRIVGAYANVHEDGEIDSQQLDWLTGELAAAPHDALLILAMHHPVYSADVVHGSNLALGEALDECFERAGRIPDAVLTGHAHNYQRFMRQIGGRAIPYIVAGAGGFHERHALGSELPALPASFPGLPDVTLEAHNATEHGFMTIAVEPGGAEVTYNTVTGGSAQPFDTFRIRRAGGASSAPAAR